MKLLKRTTKGNRSILKNELIIHIGVKKELLDSGRIKYKLHGILKNFGLPRNYFLRIGSVMKHLF